VRNISIFWKKKVELQEIRPLANLYGFTQV